MKTGFYWEIARSIRRAFRKPLPDAPAYQELFRGKKVLEIGGPSELFRRVLPIYEAASSVDGVNFSSSTVWEGRLIEGLTYRRAGREVGRQYICEATDLGQISPNSYDGVLSSNSLEHVANPLKAISQWLRVLRPGGYLLLVLPRKEGNFDHRREVTKFDHLLDDFEHNMSEHDLTHLEEILDLHDYAMDPPSVDRETMRLRSLANFENRCLHHHVFDPTLVDEIFRHFDLQRLQQTTIVTDYIAVARKRSVSERVVA
jgi:SAM-dependent methyltransferase